MKEKQKRKTASNEAVSATSFLFLTNREQEIPDFYKWWDELRLMWRCPWF